MDDLIKEFLQESNENLDRLDQDFVKLESDPSNLELLKSIFRTIHTIKGTCGFLGFTKLEALTHVGESLLSNLRADELLLTPTIADSLLEMVDAIRVILKEIETSGTEGTAEYPELIEKLKQLQKQPKAATPEAEKKVAPPAVPAEPVAKEGENKAVPEDKAAKATGPQDSTPSHPEPCQKSSSNGKRKKPEVIPGRIGGALVSHRNVRPEAGMVASQQLRSEQTAEGQERWVRVSLWSRTR
jgi:two-component system chemotaxis sensor kinase CheA